MLGRAKIILGVFAVGLFLVPISIASADTPYILATIAPQTIGLTGSTWAKSDVTVAILAEKEVTQAVIDTVKQAVDDWNRAIQAKLSPQLSPFHLVLPTSNTPDITFRVRKTWDQTWSTCSARDGFLVSCELNIVLDQVASNKLQSISLARLGFALGVWDSDHPKDVMYTYTNWTNGPTNITLSQCDLAAWKVVMDWLLKGSPKPYTPSVTYLTCSRTS